MNLIEDFEDTSMVSISSIIELPNIYSMYTFLDYFFTLFHGFFTLFNMVGWAWKKTRKIHLVSIGLTALSWFGLGTLYGWGYCPCTDWHWQIKRKLGDANLPNSYIKYYVDRITSFSWDPYVVDAVVLIFGLLILVLSAWLNLQDYKIRLNR